jgi:hypothetical protein
MEAMSHYGSDVTLFICLVIPIDDDLGELWACKLLLGLLY